MPEVPYDPSAEGFFKVSRRFTSSSRWFTCSPWAVKLMVYMLDWGSNPMNPHIGDVMQTGPALAAKAGIPHDHIDAAVKELLGEDRASQSQKKSGAFIEELTRQGKIVGFRILNFDEYNPGARERSERYKRIARQERAKKAAEARWSKAKKAVDHAMREEAKQSFTPPSAPADPGPAHFEEEDDLMSQKVTYPEDEELGF
jgi:hypothetical protein